MVPVSCVKKECGEGSDDCLTPDLHEQHHVSCDYCDETGEVSADDAVDVNEDGEDVVQPDTDESNDAEDGGDFAD